MKGLIDRFPEDKCSKGQVSSIFSFLVSSISHMGEALQLSVHHRKNGTTLLAAGRCHMLLEQANK